MESGDSSTASRADRKGTGLVGILLPLALALGTGSPALAQDRHDAIKIGVLAKRGAEKCLEKWGPTAEYLTEQTPGHSFVIVPLGYDEVCPAVERGEVDFVLPNPGLYVTLERFYGVSQLATLNNRPLREGYTVFGGVIFRRADRGDIEHLADLKGKTFMAVDERSFGGWQAAWRELKEHGIDPYRDLAELSFGGTHDAVVYAVRDGKVDAGTVRTETLERMAEEGNIRLDDFRAFSHDHTGREGHCFPFLHSTRTYPEWPFAKLAHTSDELAETVAVVLLNMPADGPAASAALCAGWVVPHNYQPVHECLKDLRIGPYKDYGKVTPRQALSQFWVWILCGVALVVGAISLAAYMTRADTDTGDSRASQKTRIAPFVELIALFVAIVMAAIVYVVFDVAEDVNQFLEQNEYWEADELLLVMPMGALGLAFFSWRRWKESRSDLAERKQVEQALRDSEQKYRVLLDNLPQNIFSKDRNSIYMSCNENFVRDLKIKPEEFAGKTDYDFFPAELADKYREDDKRVMESGKTEEIEEKYIQDGQQVIVHTVKTPVKDENGKSIGVLGIFWDITKRKRAEEALQEESGRLRSLVGLLDTMDVGLTIQDRDYNITYQNPFMQKQFGGLGDKCYKVYECHDEVCDGCPVAKAFKDGQPHNADRTTPAPGGGVFFWENTAHPIKDAAGKVTSCFEVVRNITERKRVEEALRDRTESLTERLKELNCLYSVSHLVEAPGISLEEILQGSVDLLPAGLKYPDAACARLVIGDRAYRTENYQDTAWKLSRDILVFGRAVGTLEVCCLEERPQADEGPFPKEERDLIAAIAERLGHIIERKRAEEKLRRYAADLEQANEEVKQFTYIVSHDLRAPLVNLKGYAGELRSAFGTISSSTDTALLQADEQQQQAMATVLQEDIPEALNFIDSSVTRMDHFIDALLKLSRVGRRELPPEPIDMNALVQATLQTLAHQIERRQVNLTVGSLPEVVANRASMEQIIGNLLNNAVIYLDPSRSGEIEISAERNSNETTFRVCDNGRGIAEEDMDKVFAPFRRAGKQDIPGEGMGLAYVQALVRRHGGRICCESEPGVGTTFTFTISNHLEKGGDHA